VPQGFTATLTKENQPTVNLKKKMEETGVAEKKSSDLMHSKKCKALKNFGSI